MKPWFNRVSWSNNGLQSLKTKLTCGFGCQIDSSNTHKCVIHTDRFEDMQILPSMFIYLRNWQRLPVAPVKIFVYSKRYHLAKMFAEQQCQKQDYPRGQTQRGAVDNQKLFAWGYAHCSPLDLWRLNRHPHSRDDELQGLMQSHWAKLCDCGQQ